MAARVIAAVYAAALEVCRFNWHLFMAREYRGAGHVDRATENMADARRIMDELADIVGGLVGEDGDE